MALFGFGKNKNKDLNDARRTLVLNQIEEMISNMNVSSMPNGMDLVRKLQNYETTLQNQPQSLSDELVVCDALLIRYLADIQEDIAKGNSNVVEVRFEAFENALNKRSKVASQDKASIGGAYSRIEQAAQRSLKKVGKKKGLLKADEVELMVNDLYTNEQLYEITLKGYQDKVDKAEAKIKELQGKRQDMSTQSQIMRAQMDLKVANDTLRKYSEASNRDFILTQMDSFNEQQKQNVSKFSEMEIQDIMTKYQENSKSDETYSALQQMMGMGSGSSSTNFNTAGSQQNADVIDEQKYADIKREIAELENACKTYQTEITKASREMQRVGQEALNLINAKKTASGAEIKNLDSQIRALQNQYSALDRRIKMLEQNRIKADNELTISRDILNNLEIQKINQKVASVSASHQSINEKAMDLRNAVQRGNENLDESNTAMSVALSEDYNTDSASDVGAEGMADDSSSEDFSDFENLIRGNEVH